MSSDHDNDDGIGVSSLTTPGAAQSRRLRPGPLSMTEEPVGSLLLIRPQGNINRATSAAFEDHLLPRVNAGKNVIVDLDGVATVTSAGLRVMAQLAETARGRSRLMFTSPNEMVVEILNGTGFDTLLDIRIRLSDALDELNSP